MKRPTLPSTWPGAARGWPRLMNSRFSKWRNRMGNQSALRFGEIRLRQAGRWKGIAGTVMGIGKRFGRQYRANLNEYRRQRSWRLLRLFLGFGFALALGGLLEVGKNLPPLVFYGLVGLMVAIAAIFATFKIVG